MGRGDGGMRARQQERKRRADALDFDARVLQEANKLADGIVAQRDQAKYDNYETEAANNPKQTLADITNKLDQRKRDFFWKVEDDLIASIDDTSIVDTAKANASKGFGLQQEQNARAMSRYGVMPTASQKRNATRMSELDSSTNYASTVNTSRLAQFDRNENLKTQLLNNSRALTGQTIDGLSNAASLQSSREQDYQNRRASYQTQKNQTIGMIAGLSAMAFL